jgi:hypothetical protein
MSKRGWDVEGQSVSGASISAHSISLRQKQAEIAGCLRKAIEQALPKATVRIWQGMPVWFIGENPVVGYSAKLNRVTLRFWNGQSFGDPMLTAVGKFRAAQIKYRDIADIDTKALRRWLRIARTNLWDMVATRNRILAPPLWMR